MSLRRFVNLVVANGETGFYSLRRINLSRHQLFYPTAAASHAQDLPIRAGRQRGSSSGTEPNGKKKKRVAAPKMESIRPPAPSFSIRPTLSPTSVTDACKLDWFPLSESKIILTDQATRTLLYDADEHCFLTMPSFHAPKMFPISISIPGYADGDGDQESSLYVMESILRPERSFQFEAFVYRFPKQIYSVNKMWHCDPLPLPPYVHDPGHKPASIRSHAVVGDAICISAEGIGGTYCFDTVNRTWSHSGDWVLPFLGQAQYVPELNLWFGMSATNYESLCSADLSPIVSAQPPKLGNVWEDLDLPEKWHSGRWSKLVSLGSGRFCIAKFFQTMQYSSYIHEPIVDQIFAVFTGLEVLAGEDNKLAGNGNGNGNGGLRMIKHKSKRYRFLSSNVIESVL